MKNNIELIRIDMNSPNFKELLLISSAYSLATNETIYDVINTLYNEAFNEKYNIEEIFNIVGDDFKRYYKTYIKGISYKIAPIYERVIYLLLLDTLKAKDGDNSYKYTDILVRKGIKKIDSYIELIYTELLNINN